MTCPDCGREAESGRATHWIGCPIPGLKARTEQAKANPKPPATSEAPGDQCDHDGCTNQKKSWSGKGAKPKYCEKHSDPKNRK